MNAQKIFYLFDIQPLILFFYLYKNLAIFCCTNCKFICTNFCSLILLSDLVSGQLAIFFVCLFLGILPSSFMNSFPKLFRKIKILMILFLTDHETMITTTCTSAKYIFGRFMYFIDLDW